MDHLDVIAGTNGTTISRTSFAIDLSGTLHDDRFNEIIRLFLSTGHETGTIAGAFFTATSKGTKKCVSAPGGTSPVKTRSGSCARAELASSTATTTVIDFTTQVACREARDELRRNAKAPGFGIFAKAIENGSVVRAIPAPNTGDKPRSFFDKTNDWAREEGWAGLGYVIFKDGEGRGPIAKNLGEERLAKLREVAGLGPNDGVFFACDKALKAQK